MVVFSWGMPWNLRGSRGRCLTSQLAEYIFCTYFEYVSYIRSSRVYLTIHMHFRPRCTKDGTEYGEFLSLLRKMNVLLCFSSLFQLTLPHLHHKSRSSRKNPDLRWRCGSIVRSGAHTSIHFGEDGLGRPGNGGFCAAPK